MLQDCTYHMHVEGRRTQYDVSFRNYRDAKEAYINAITTRGVHKVAIVASGYDVYERYQTHVVAIYNA